MTRRAARVLRLREDRGPTPRARRIAFAAILLTLAGTAGDCAGRVAETSGLAAAEARP